LYKKNEIVSTF